jgi:hypothetical protein
MRRSRQGDGTSDDVRTVTGYKVVSAVRNVRIGRIVGREGRYYIVRRSFSRRRYPLPIGEAQFDRERGRMLMRLPRRRLFAAPQVRRNGELHPATDGYYNELGRYAEAAATAGELHQQEASAQRIADR